ncbi:MAG TPA: ATP-binding protein [Symbiobacteriaceae bacterium]|jgi:signal transduction histidine kinase/HAMP domain-containing protein
MQAESAPNSGSTIRSVTILGVVWAIQLALLMLYMPFQFQVGTARFIYPYLPYFGTAYGVAAALILLDWAQVGMPRLTGWAGKVLLILAFATQTYIIAIKPWVITGMIFYGAEICALVLGAFFPDWELRCFQWLCALLGVSFGTLMLTKPLLFPTALFGHLPAWLPAMFLAVGLLQPLARFLARYWRQVEWVSLLAAVIPFGWFAVSWGLIRQWTGVAGYASLTIVIILSALYIRRPWQIHVPGMRRRVMALALTVSVVPLVAMGGFGVQAAQRLDRRDAWDSLRISALQVEREVQRLVWTRRGEALDLGQLLNEVGPSFAQPQASLRILPLADVPNGAGEHVDIREEVSAQNVLFLTATIRRPDLRLAIEVTEPAVLAYDQANQLAVGALTLMVLIAALAFGLSLALSARITRHLSEVRDVAAALGARHFRVRMRSPADSNDEVTDLAATVNGMAETLQTYSEELQRLLTVTDTALAHLTLQDLLRELIERIRETLPADIIAIMLMTADSRHLEIAAAHGTPVGRLLAVGEGYAGRIAASGKMLVIDEVSKSDITSPCLADPVSSVMGAPLVVENRVIGVVQVGLLAVHHFTPDDARLFQLVADRIALAIDHARLYEAEVAARREVEEQRAEVQRLNAGLEQRVAERTTELTAANQELEAFAYSVSHDLRGPLRTVNGFSLAILEDYGDRLDADGQDYLKRIIAGTERMSSLIDSMLRLSRVSRSELVPSRVDLTAMARDVFADLERQQPERCVRLEVEDGLAASADERLLRIAMENLLGNAWKFTARSPDPLVAVGAIRSGEATAFFVRDNGAGFNMAYAGKLFSPFQRLHTNGEFEGNGIGLAIVHRIITRHGGRIWAESTVGSGATFLFTL